MAPAVLVSIRVSRFFIFSSNIFFVSIVGDCTKRFPKDEISAIRLFSCFLLCFDFKDENEIVFPLIWHFKKSHKSKA